MMNFTKLLRYLVSESVDDFENTVHVLSKQPELKDVESFVTHKLDNDEDSFSATELQALSRNVDFAARKLKGALAPEMTVKRVKEELLSYGLKFTPRPTVKHVRGVTSNPNGTHPFAGSGGGGSGFGSDYHGATFTSFGGGPGAVGGGYEWDPEDKKNLSMGAKRKK